MRIKMFLTIPRIFPLGHRLGVLAFLKEAVRSQSDEFYDSFFIQKERMSKPYAFATNFRNIKIENEQIHADELIVTVCTSNLEFLIYLLNGCKKLQHFTYRGIEMSLRKVEVLKERSITKPQIWFKTLSPILIETEGGKPILADQDPFVERMNLIMFERIHQLEGRPLYQPLKIVKKKLDKKVVKEDFHQFQDEFLFFTANHGVFLLEGDPRDLSFCYKNGIGKRTGVGFGAVEML